MRTIVVGVVVLACACTGPGPSGGTGGGAAGGLVIGVGGGSTSSGGGVAGGAAVGGGSTTAGGTATAGGRVTTGGGVATGGGATGPAAGSHTVSTTLFNPKVVTGPDGAFHVVYRTQTPSSIVYGRCDSDCGQPARWTFVTVEPTAGFAVGPRLAIAADGRVHIVWVQNSPTKYQYATCGTNCLAGASSWTITELDGVCDWDDQNTNLALDSTGRLSFMTTDFNAQRVCLSTCAGACTTATNWQTDYILDLRGNAPTSVRTRLGFTATGSTLHFVFDDLIAGLRYSRCTSNCTQFASWQQSGPLFFHGDGAVSLAGTPQGRVVLAYNQGTTSAQAPADVKAFDDRTLVFECSGTCDQRTSWQGVATGATGDGTHGVAAIADATGIGVVMTQVAGTTLSVCESACATPASWTVGTLENAASLMAGLPDPYSLPGCVQGGSTVPAQLASWAPEFPAVGVSSRGLVAFTGVRGLRTCPGVTTPTIFPGYGRLIFAPP